MVKGRMLATAALAVVLGAVAPAVALENRVVVMTSYPDERVALFETAFEKAHPGTDFRFGKEAAAA